MTKQNILIGAIAVIALFVLVRTFLVSSSTITAGAFTPSNGINMPAGTALSNGYVLPNPTTYDYLVSRTYMVAQGIFGYGNGTSVNTNEQIVRQTLVAATTTPCSIQNPLNATSTYSSTLNATVATSSAGIFDVGTSTTAFATSSLGSAQTIAANTQGTLSYAGSSGSGGNIIGPLGWVVYGMNTGSVSYGYTYGGTCQATFKSAN